MGHPPSVLKNPPWAAQRKVVVSQNLVISYVHPNLQKRTSDLQISPQGDLMLSEKGSDREGKEISSPLITKGTVAHWGQDSESPACPSISDKVHNP